MASLRISLRPAVEFGGQCVPAQVSSARLPTLAFAFGSTSCLRLNQCTHQRKVHVSSFRSEAFGNAETILSARPANGRRLEGTAAPVAVSAYTQEQAKLVNRSWEILKKDAGNHGMTFFSKVFEIAPSASQLFSFLRDSTVPLDQNPKLKGHALTVFKLAGDAANQLGEKGGLEALQQTLQELGASHYSYGIVNEHFDVVRYALLQTIQEALPQMSSTELKDAWGQAYDELVKVMKDEMKRKAAAE